MLNGLNADHLEIISIVSFDLCNRHLEIEIRCFLRRWTSYSSNDYCSLVTWQMLSFQ